MMLRITHCGLYLSALLVPFLVNIDSASAESESELRLLKDEIQAVRETYEKRISDLEQKLKAMEVKQVTPQNSPSAAVPVSTDSSGRNTYGNTFNPSIGVILNGRFANFSKKSSEISGFAIGEEGERGKEGLAIDESEINASANVDDKFYGSMTAAIVREEGEDKVELEEAYIQTLPGISLPRGFNLKAGRAFWNFGYLNEHHTHADDFADRPLPYRVFLNNGFNDDGLQVSYVLPTDFYSEIGGGAFRGDDFPFGEAGDNGINGFSGFARIGGDIGEDQNWRLGAYYLGGDTDGRATSEGELNFAGDSELYATDFKYTWAPTGNPKEKELILQSEYMWRTEDGTYEDATIMSESVPFDQSSSGFYAQVVYKFLPQWRVGARYSQLFPPGAPQALEGSLLDANGHDPLSYSAMVDWTNSEFSRVRFQFNGEELSEGDFDNQFIFQYIMSIGAHGAHAY